MYKYVGIFNHKGNKIDITDPCYDKGTWCRTTQELPEGEYECWVDIVDYGDWGKRVALSQIIKKDLDNSDIYARTRIAEIGVDAGLAGFFDNKPDYDDAAWSEFCEWSWQKENQIERKTVALANEDNAAKCEGFFTSSGFGDGCYDVIALYDKDDKLIGYEINFIEEENEEDEE